MTDLLAAMKDAEMDLAAAGDLTGAFMLGEIIESYTAGRQLDGNAVIALNGSKKRLRDFAPLEATSD